MRNVKGLGHAQLRRLERALRMIEWGMINNDVTLRDLHNLLTQGWITVDKDLEIKVTAAGLSRLNEARHG